MVSYLVVWKTSGPDGHLYDCNTVAILEKVIETENELRHLEDIIKEKDDFADGGLVITGLFRLGE